MIQVKNPLAPTGGDQRVGPPPSRRAGYPDEIMSEIFGRGTKGRASYGLRFASCERAELLDYEGAELLLIAAKEGTELGEGTGQGKLNDLSGLDIDNRLLFASIAMDNDVISPDALEGHWI